MCEVMARGVVTRIPFAREVDWNAFMSTEAAAFYMPLDPYLQAHAWGQFGADNANARPSAFGSSDSSLGHQQSIPVSQISSPTNVVKPLHTVSPNGVSAARAMALSCPPVPQVSPEIAALISRNRAQAYERRQQKRLQAIRALPVTSITVHDTAEETSVYIIDTPGIAPVPTGATC